MSNKSQIIHLFFTMFLAFPLLGIISQKTAGQGSSFSENHLMLLMEELSSQSEENMDFTILEEEFACLAEDPVKINNASFEEISRIRLLTDFQIQSLINYIDKNGPVLSLYELQFVHGFDKELIKLMIPFIDLHNKEPVIPENFGEKLAYGKHQVFIRSSRKFNKTEKNDQQLSKTEELLGNPAKLYLRYDYKYKRNVRWGLTAEKDAGEEFFKGNNKYGFDFYSAHLHLKNSGFIKNLSIGDYHLRFGQGLVLWSGFSFGKTSMPLNVKKRAAGITGYRSTDENRFFRGAATTLSHKKIDLSFFYSGKRIDGNIVEYDSTMNKAITVSSLQTSGDHSLSGLTSDKDAVFEQVAGSNISMNFTKLKTGLTFAHTWLDTELNPPERDYNQFYFRGKELTHLSADYQYLINWINLYGEAAYCFGRGWAFINGAHFNVNSEFQLALLYRNFQKEYFSFFGNAFSENSGGRNEEGFYMGTEISPLPKWKISAYFDAYRSAWLRYLVTAPSEGTDYLVKIDYHPSSEMEMYWKIKGETDIKDINNELAGVADQEEINRQKIRYHISYTATPLLRFRNRIEIARSKEGDDSPEWGYMLYQDILYTLRQLPIDIRARYAIFDTDSYNTRIYTYENDVLYSFSVPAFFGKGTRSYLLIKYSPLENINLWVKYSRTRYSNNIPDSFNSIIPGNVVNHVKFQVRFRF